MSQELEKASSLIESPRLAVVGPPAPPSEPLETAAQTPSPAQLSVKEQSDYLWNTHKYKNDYIRFADTKAAFTVAFCSALLAALYKDGLHQLFLGTAPKGWTPSAWMALASFLSLAIAIGSGVWTIRPRLASPQPKGLIYWGGIVEHGSPETFWSTMRSQTPEQLAEHLAHHVFRLSRVAKQKYFWVSFSMTAATVGGSLAAITILFR